MDVDVGEDEDVGAGVDVHVYDVVGAVVSVGARVGVD